MKSRTDCLINNSGSRRKFNSKNYSNAKAWVIKAIAQEETHPSHQMWKKELTAEYQFNERLRRIRFLRKHGRADPELLLIADCLDQCEKEIDVALVLAQNAVGYSSDFMCGNQKNRYEILFLMREKN